MSKQKRPVRDERRRDQVELNLLDHSQERGRLASARRGCTLPFLGGSLLVILFTFLMRGAS